MIEVQAKQIITLRLLEEYTGCKLVPANTTKNLPAYPFISFSVINIDTKKGTYAQVGNTLYMPAKVKYSFTVQSDNEAEALLKAMDVKDFFEEAKRQVLADNEIIVADVGGITPRDNLLTMEYEYRKGLDVTLSLNNIIAASADTGEIDSISINDINIEKE